LESCQILQQERREFQKVLDNLADGTVDSAFKGRTERFAKCVDQLGNDLHSFISSYSINLEVKQTKYTEPLSMKSKQKALPNQAKVSKNNDDDVVDEVDPNPDDDDDDDPQVPVVRSKKKLLRRVYDNSDDDGAGALRQPKSNRSMSRKKSKRSKDETSESSESSSHEFVEYTGSSSSEADRRSPPVLRKQSNKSHDVSTTAATGSNARSQSESGSGLRATWSDQECFYVFPRLGEFPKDSFIGYEKLNFLDAKNQEQYMNKVKQMRKGIGKIEEDHCILLIGFVSTESSVLDAIDRFNQEIHEHGYTHSDLALAGRYFRKMLDEMPSSGIMNWLLNCAIVSKSEEAVKREFSKKFADSSIHVRFVRMRYLLLIKTGD
jgi:hypothetical protein